MNHAFIVDAMRLSGRRNRRWYQNNLMTTLIHAKEKQTRGIDESIALAQELQDIFNEKLPLPEVVPLREVEQSQDDSLMRPIAPELLDIIYKGTEKGDADRYLHERYKARPEDRFLFRIQTSWDYGWQQKQSRVPPRDMNRGRLKLLAETFYRRNNAGPDPPHYSEPSGGQLGICSEYSCNPN